LIPCDSDRCEDCREPGTTETKPIIDKGKGSMYPKPDPELEDILTQTENMIASLQQMASKVKTKMENQMLDELDEILEQYYICNSEESPVTKDANLAIKIYNDDNKGAIPERAHENDAGFDVKYTGEEPIEIRPQQTVYIDLYIALEIPPGTVCQLMSRSSLVKKGIEVKAGTIDAGYTGNIGVLLYNNSQTSYTIQSQERIAQAVFLQLAPIDRIESVTTRQKLGNTNRGEDGFGSTGQFDIASYLFEKEQEEREEDQIITPRELTNEQQQSWNKLLEQHNDIFASNLSQLGRSNVIQHEIKTGDTVPIKQ